LVGPREPKRLPSDQLSGGLTPARHRVAGLLSRSSPSSKRDSRSPPVAEPGRPARACIPSAAEGRGTRRAGGAWPPSGMEGGHDQQPAKNPVAFFADVTGPNAVRARPHARGQADIAGRSRPGISSQSPRSVGFITATSARPDRPAISVCPPHRDHLPRQFCHASIPSSGPAAVSAPV